MFKLIDESDLYIHGNSDIMFLAEDESLGLMQKIKNGGWFWIACFLVGFAAGFISALVK